MIDGGHLSGRAKSHLASKFPGLVYPDKAPVRPGELIGYLSALLQGDVSAHMAAQRALPKRNEPCSECGAKVP